MIIFCLIYEVPNNTKDIITSMSFFNRHEDDVMEQLMQQDAEMEEQMQQFLEEMEYDDAVFQYVMLEQEDEDEIERKSWGGSRHRKSPNKK